MASNDFSPASSSDSEVSEIEDFELEVEDSPNLSDQATDVEERQEAYADEPLADAEWLALYEQERLWLARSHCNYWCPGITSEIALDPYPFGDFCGSVMGFETSLFRDFENS